jgi:hypothetical protein
LWQSMHCDGAACKDVAIELAIMHALQHPHGRSVASRGSSAVGVAAVDCW